MKKILLLTVIILSSSLSASAWHRTLDKAAIEIAWQNLNEETKHLFSRYVGQEHQRTAGHLAWHRRNGRMLESEGWHRLHLNSYLEPSATDDNDAYVQINKALEIIHNHTNHDKAEVRLAINIVINLVIDMHNFANVTIEGIPISQGDFTTQRSRGTAGGKKPKLSPMQWSALWNNEYVRHRGAFSPEMYAEDLQIMFGDKKAAFSEGSVSYWATDVGATARSMYDIVTSGGAFHHHFIIAQEEMYFSYIAKAGYRIAALLNQHLK